MRKVRTLCTPTSAYSRILYICIWMKIHVVSFLFICHIREKVFFFILRRNKSLFYFVIRSQWIIFETLNIAAPTINKTKKNLNEFLLHEEASEMLKLPSTCSTKNNKLDEENGKLLNWEMFTVNIILKEALDILRACRTKRTSSVVVKNVHVI